MTRYGTIAQRLGLLLVGLATAGAAAAQERGRPEVWDIALGSSVLELSDMDFQEYACGSDGGPPGAPLDGWSGFSACPPEADGLREISFRYDDELEYRARAMESQAWIERYAGTRVFGAPVLVSALVADDGTVEGLRIVTDPRADLRERQAAYGLRGNFMARYGAEGWSCRDTPPDDRHRPIGRLFVNQRCEKATEDLFLIVEGRYYRKPGQAAFDPATRQLTPGRFESSARLEVRRRTAAR